MSNTTDKTEPTKAKTEQPAPVSGCCAPTKQASCCAPSEKPQCCGSQQPKTSSGGCGCQ